MNPTPTYMPYGTGGGGHVFENKVQAFYLLTMLAGGHAPCIPEGKLTSIVFQTGSRGYRTDDLLLIQQDDTGQNHRLLIQSKHGIKWTASDPATQESLARAWEDFLNPELFDPRQDAFAIVSGPTTLRVANDARIVLDWARHYATGQQFLDIIKLAPQNKRSFITLIRTVLEQTPIPPSDDDQLWRFIKTLHLLSFDFDIAAGQSEAIATTMIRQHRKDTDTNHAGLWAQVCQWADEFNQTGGELDLGFLPEMLNSKPPLKSAFPQTARKFLPPIRLPSCERWRADAGASQFEMKAASLLSSLLFETVDTNIDQIFWEQLLKLHFKGEKSHEFIQTFARSVPRQKSWQTALAAHYSARLAYKSGDIETARRFYLQSIELINETENLNLVRFLHLGRARLTQLNLTASSSDIQVQHRHLSEFLSLDLPDQYKRYHLLSIIFGTHLRHITNANKSSIENFQNLVSKYSVDINNLPSRQNATVNAIDMVSIIRHKVSVTGRTAKQVAELAHSTSKADNNIFHMVQCYAFRSIVFERYGLLEDAVFDAVAARTLSNLLGDVIENEGMAELFSANQQSQQASIIKFSLLDSGRLPTMSINRYKEVSNDFANLTNTADILIFHDACSTQLPNI